MAIASSRKRLRRWLACSFRIEHFVGDEQIFEHSPRDDGFFDDARHVFRGHAAVPDLLWINHDGWSTFALIEAASTVRAHERVETSAFDLGFE